MSIQEDLQALVLKSLDSGSPINQKDFDSLLMRMKEPDELITPGRFGVKGDGVVDDTVAMQAALDYCESNIDAGALSPTHVLQLPVGVFKLSQPLQVRSGVRIIGSGLGTKISPTGGFSGAGLFYLKPGTSSWVQDVEISNISTDGSYTVLTDEYSLFACTGVAATNVITATGHDFYTNQKVWIKPGTLTGGAGLVTNLDYYIRDISGSTFKLAATAGGAAIDFTTDISAATITTYPVTNHRCKFNNIFMQSTDGIVLRNYCQDTLFQNICSYGAINKMLHFNGNWNILRRINKEGITGSSADPYIKISQIYDGNRSDGNFIDGINIEGLGSPNKTPFHFVGCDNLYIQNMWCELQGTPGDLTDGYVMRFEDCFSVFIKGAPSIQMSIADAKIKVDSVLNLNIEQLYLDPTAATIYETLEISANSNVNIDTAVTRGNDSALKCLSTPNLRVKRIFSKNNSITPGTTQFTETLYTGSNLLLNGSFENLTHGWAIDSGATVTPSLVASGVTVGKAMQCTLASTGNFNVHQPIVFTAEHVGKPFTFTAAVKTTSAGGYITPFISGAGIDLSTNLVNFARNGDWTIISQTFTPLSAGTCSIGVYCWNLTLAQLDEFSLVPGTIGTLNPSTFKSLEVNGRSITVGNSAPTGGSGTWRVGDLRLNSEPSANESAFWVCVTAGDPGTWIPCATLSTFTRILGTPVAAGGTHAGKQIEINATGDPYIKIWNEVTNLGYQVFHSGGINYIDSDAYQIRNRQTGDIWDSWSSANGRQINSASSQKLGFWGATPGTQPAAIANATDAASVIARLNDLLAALRSRGIIAT